ERPDLCQRAGVEPDIARLFVSVDHVWSDGERDHEGTVAGILHGGERTLAGQRAADHRPLRCRFEERTTATQTLPGERSGWEPLVDNDLLECRTIDGADERQGTGSMGERGGASHCAREI